MNSNHVICFCLEETVGSTPSVDQINCFFFVKNHLCFVLVHQATCHRVIGWKCLENDVETTSQWSDANVQLGIDDFVRGKVIW